MGWVFFLPPPPPPDSRETSVSFSSVPVGKSKSATASQIVSELEQGALSPAVPEWRLHGVKQGPRQRARLNGRNAALSKEAIYLRRYGTPTTPSLRDTFVKRGQIDLIKEANPITGTMLAMRGCLGALWERFAVTRMTKAKPKARFMKRNAWAAGRRCDRRACWQRCVPAAMHVPSARHNCCPSFLSPGHRRHWGRVRPMGQQALKAKGGRRG